MKRGYQLDYAAGRAQMYDKKSREIKANRIVKTLSTFFGEKKIKTLTVLDLGSSTGIIDSILAESFKHVIGTDIDIEAIKFAQKTFKKKNLSFKVEDAMKLSFKASVFDVVICTHVCEHVPSQEKLFAEIYRVLKPGGVCYLAAQNKLWPLEAHHNLPFLSYLPQNLANVYIRVTKKKDKYYENPQTYWSLQQLTSKFNVLDITPKILTHPHEYGYEDSLKNGSPIALVAALSSPITKYLTPTMFWLLVKAK